MGRHKNIESPEIMWELFTEYKESVKGKPIKKMVFVGKDGNRDNEERERPLTMEGFQNWLDDNEIITDVTDYFENKENRYKDFVRICTRIKRNIRQDQIEGGMAGIYNPSITQRLNGLTEKVQQDGNQEVTIKVKYERKGANNNPERTASGTGEDIS